MWPMVRRLGDGVASVPRAGTGFESASQNPTTITGGNWFATREIGKRAANEPPATGAEMLRLAGNSSRELRF